MVTGADRIAANGDTANKIGTYGLAVSRAITGSRSWWSRRPPPSTRRRRTGPRSRSRNGRGGGVDQFPARNPAFDVTPGELVAAIVTEDGIHRAPYAFAAGRAGAGVVRARPRGQVRDAYPLTENVAALLPLAGRPMIEYILDAVEAWSEVVTVHVVTNSRFAADFEAWSRERPRRRGRGPRRRNGRQRRPPGN